MRKTKKQLARESHWLGREHPEVFNPIYDRLPPNIVGKLSAADCSVLVGILRAEFVRGRTEFAREHGYL